MPRTIGAILALLCALLLPTRPTAGQGTPPPIQGVTGTIATDETIRGEHKAAGKAAQGVKKILPGGKSTSENPLDALITGSRVVVREVAGGGDAARTTTEGVVIDVNPAYSPPGSSRARPGANARGGVVRSADAAVEYPNAPNARIR